MSSSIKNPADSPTLFGAAPAKARAGIENVPACGQRFVKVAVERGIDSAELSEGLTYRCDLPGVAVGDRVRVPLGRKNAPVQGTVLEVGGVELLDGYPPDRVKGVVDHRGGGLSPALVELARWLSSYYVCPLGMVLSTMVPAAVKKATGSRLEGVVSRRAQPEATPNTTPSVDPETSAPMVTAAIPAKTRQLIAAVAAIDPAAFPMTSKELAARVGSKTTGPIARLVKLGVLTTSTRRVVRDYGWAEPGPGTPTPGSSPRPTLTREQSVIVDGIGAALDSFRVHLIRGITGSGKTEVYLQLIERVIAGGKSAIVLVPEIALTPQTSGRFRERFATIGVSVLHSGLSASQRNGEWERVSRGESRVVVGARSAVFAPLTNLGIIVVDEEHDSSYKQDQLPRYNARDVAIKRAQLAGCPAVLGSATPSLESWFNASGVKRKSLGDARHAGSSRYSLWELTHRAGGGELPSVRIVNLAEERRARARTDPQSAHRQHALGPTLEAAIGSTLDAGGQVILLLNRRGFAHYIACRDGSCGWVLSCDDCDARLVLHKDRSLPRGGDVACHHCLARRILPKACPVCGKALNVFGIGTQRLEDEICRAFGASHGLDHSNMLRIDSDSMGSARDYFEALGRFSRGEVQLLLGTQMIAKGLDFPNVRLVGVVNADTALNMPDFRASERTFQLVSQVAGRAGRSAAGGRVIVQTMEPNSPAIVCAARHDYVAFAEAELATRCRARLPPATRMARIVCRDPDAGKAEASAAGVARALRECVASLAIPARIDGPAICAIERTHAHYRFEVTLTADRAGDIQRVLAACRSAGVVGSDARTAVDVDPVSLL